MTSGRVAPGGIWRTIVWEIAGTPERPEDLLRHECMTFRSQSTGALYAWELERGRRNWRVPVRGGVVSSDTRLSVSMAEQGLGLAYAFEPVVLPQLESGRLVPCSKATRPRCPDFSSTSPVSRGVPHRSGCS